MMRLFLWKGGIGLVQDSGKTKYAALMEELKEKILSGEIRAGDRLPSENELSVSYGLSRHTVRKALAILENEGYVTAEHGRGTFCSERMRHRKNSKNIAVITTYISDYIFPRLIQCLEDVLTKDVDGLIIEPSKSQILCRNMHLYQKLDEYRIPYVFIQGCYPQMRDKPAVLMDDAKGGYLITKYLIDTGHKNILGIFKADDSQGAERHKGYVRALQEAGMPYLPERVIWFHTEDRKVKPAVMIKMMLAQGILVDSVVCYNDQIAMEVIQKLNEMGKKVPEDVSVTGYDNSFYARSGPIGLTTIAHPQEKLGEIAAELLLEQIRGIPEEESKVQRLMEPELIVRDSCRKRKN